MNGGGAGREPSSWRCEVNVTCQEEDHPLAIDWFGPCWLTAVVVMRRDRVKGGALVTLSNT
jgi:hypothetical protein